MVKKITYQKAKEILLQAGIIEESELPGITKRYDRFITDCYQKKAFQILMDNTLKIFEEAVEGQQIEVKVERLNEINEFGFSWEIKSINGKEKAETIMEKMLEKTINNTFEAINLEDIFEGVAVSTYNVFKKADEVLYNNSVKEKRKPTVKESLAHYLLTVFHGRAFEIEEELNENRDQREN